MYESTGLVEQNTKKKPNQIKTLDPNSHHIITTPIRIPSYILSYFGCDSQGAEWNRNNQTDRNSKMELQFLPNFTKH